MKLHHFIAQKTTEEGARVRDLGKSLVQVVPPTTSVVQSTEEPVVEAAKKVEREPELALSADKVEAHREFAEHQLAKSSPSVHHKLRHYD